MQKMSKSQHRFLHKYGTHLLYFTEYIHNAFELHGLPSGSLLGIHDEFPHCSQNVYKLLSLKIVVLEILLPRMSHKCSMGLMLAEYRSHSNTIIFFQEIVPEEGKHEGIKGRGIGFHEWKLVRCEDFLT